MIRTMVPLSERRVDLEAIARQYETAARHFERRVVVCAGTGCMAGGALGVFQEFVKQIGEAGLKVVTTLKPEDGASHDGLYLSHSGCQGFCQMGPLVTIEPDEILYTKVKATDVTEIVQTTLMDHEVVQRLLYVDASTAQPCRGQGDIPFYQRQQRTVLQLCGRIDPEDIREYIYRGGYMAARRAFCEMSPEAHLRRDDPFRIARPGRRRLSHRPEVGTDSSPGERQEIRDLQRRRGRSRRVHGPQRDGGKPP